MVVGNDNELCTDLATLNNILEQSSSAVVSAVSIVPQDTSSMKMKPE